MKQTENFKLSLMEMTDLLSVKPLNENAEKIDATLTAQAQEIGARLKLVGGSYTGDGKHSVTIQTPGIRPQALLMRRVRTVGAMGGVPRFERECGFSDASVDGCCWLMWRGEDIPVQYYRFRWAGDDPVTGEVDAPMYEAVETAIRFTPEPGSVTWKLSVDVDFDHSFLVNNKEGEAYEWIAFGTAE